MKKPMTYADAGVDIDKANRLVGTISKIARQTNQPGVMGDIGGFGGLFSLNLTGIEKPVLVSSTDGVGTKLKIAFMLDRHDTIGIDLVAMCVNDIIVQGAKPLFFLDYLSTGKLDNDRAADILSGIGEGCRQAQCALIGGETAEMPGLYNDNEYDLAGFSVGMVDHENIIDGSKICIGDKLIGIASSGLHSNGFSLVRKLCFEVLNLGVDADVPELGKSIGEELLTPTKIYVEPVQELVNDFPVHGLAHITGGGLSDNILRVVPQGCDIRIVRDSWEIPPVFSFLQEAGNISDSEMMRTFNNGIGMVAIVPNHAADNALQRLGTLGHKAYPIGEILESRESNQKVLWD